MTSPAHFAGCLFSIALLVASLYGSSPANLVLESLSILPLFSKLQLTYGTLPNPSTRNQTAHTLVRLSFMGNRSSLLLSNFYSGNLLHFSRRMICKGKSIPWGKPTSPVIRVTSEMCLDNKPKQITCLTQDARQAMSFITGISQIQTNVGEISRRIEGQDEIRLTKIAPESFNLEAFGNIYAKQTTIWS